MRPPSPGPRPARRHRRLLTAAALAALAAAGACTLEPSPAPEPSGTTTTTATTTTTTTAPTDGQALRLTFDGPAEGDLPSLDNAGDASVLVEVATRNGGQVRAGEGRRGVGDGAARFPAHDPAPSSARAALRVVAAGVGDPLDPGDRPFSFGASVRLDASSEDTSEGSVDDGDNVVQRGLFDDVSQYKIQVDRRVPSCRVKGAAGEVLVKADASIAPDRWYELRCAREGDTVTLTVTTAEAAGTPATTTGQGPTGDLTPASPAVALSVGGKLQAEGEVATATDQLNGLVDDVFLRIG